MLKIAHLMEMSFPFSVSIKSGNTCTEGGAIIYKRKETCLLKKKQKTEEEQVKRYYGHHSVALSWLLGPFTKVQEQELESSSFHPKRRPGANGKSRI